MRNRTCKTGTVNKVRTNGTFGRGGKISGSGLFNYRKKAVCTAQKRQFHAPKGPQHARSGHISASRKCNENLHLHVEMPYCCIPPIRSAITRSKYHRGSQCKNNPSCHCKSSTLSCRHHNKVDGSLVVKASHPTDKKRHCIPEA